MAKYARLVCIPPLFASGRAADLPSDAPVHSGASAVNLIERPLTVNAVMPLLNWDATLPSFHNLKYAQTG